MNISIKPNQGILPFPDPRSRELEIPKEIVRSGKKGQGHMMTFRAWSRLLGSSEFVDHAFKGRKNFMMPREEQGNFYSVLTPAEALVQLAGIDILKMYNSHIDSDYSRNFGSWIEQVSTATKGRVPPFISRAIGKTQGDYKERLLSLGSSVQEAALNAFNTTYRTTDTYDYPRGDVHTQIRTLREAFGYMFSSRKG